MSRQTGAGSICLISSTLINLFYFVGSAEGHTDPAILVIRRKERKACPGASVEHFAVLQLQCLTSDRGWDACLPQNCVPVSKNGLHLDAEDMITWKASTLKIRLFSSQAGENDPLCVCSAVNFADAVSICDPCTSLQIRAQDIDIGKFFKRPSKCTLITIPISHRRTLRVREAE